MADQPQTRTMTAEEFLQLPESDERMELIDGEIFVSPPPTRIHQQIVLRTAAVIYTLPFNTIDDVTIAPIGVRFDDGTVFEPDVIWIDSTSDQCMWIDDKHLSGAPSLVVEVLSPSTSGRDRGKKIRHI